MNINFELYRIFYTVANHGNITKASEELMISQPAISKSIKNLEEQLGGTLFIRTKRGVILTDEGKEFYKYIKQAMEYITKKGKFEEKTKTKKFKKKPLNKNYKGFSNFWKTVIFFGIISFFLILMIAILAWV